jgi:hypothetical protein
VQTRAYEVNSPEYIVFVLAQSTVSNYFDVDLSTCSGEKLGVYCVLLKARVSADLEENTHTKTYGGGYHSQ